MITRAIKNPVVMLHRHNGAFIFSAYSAEPVVKSYFRFPFGAPVIDGYSTRLENGYATYNFPKAQRRECRVFVEQQSGIVSCYEKSPSSAQYRRRIVVTGLENATVRFAAESDYRDNIHCVLNANLDFCLNGQPFDSGYVEIMGETFFEVRDVTGTLCLSMPFPVPFEEYIKS